MITYRASAEKDQQHKGVPDRKGRQREPSAEMLCAQQAFLANYYAALGGPMPTGWSSASSWAQATTMASSSSSASSTFESSDSEGSNEMSDAMRSSMMELRLGGAGARRPRAFRLSDMD